MISLRSNKRPVDTETGRPKYVVNIARPDILPETIDAQREFHAWVKDTELEIMVSDAFVYMTACIAENQHYIGKGFRYMFWFFSQEDKDTFIAYLESKGISYETSDTIG